MNNLEALKKLTERVPDSLISSIPKGGALLDYVGHAATTKIILDADPLWNWEPLSVDAQGLPLFDEAGGLWIKLTIAGVTRLGYGDAAGKKGPNATKEAIGDAIRNAAMRFGVALELWSKADFYDNPESESQDVELIGDAELSTLRDLLAAYGRTESDYCKIILKISSLELLPMRNFAAAVEDLKARIKKKGATNG